MKMMQFIGIVKYLVFSCITVECWQHYITRMLSSVLSSSYLTVSLEASHNLSSMETLTHPAIIYSIRASDLNCFTTNTTHVISSNNGLKVKYTNFSPFLLTWMIGFLRCWLSQIFWKYFDWMPWVKRIFHMIFCFKLDWLRLLIFIFFR